MNRKSIFGLFCLCVVNVLMVKAQVTASFSYAQADSCAPSTIDFLNTSTGNYTAASWNWGDGSTPYTGANPTPQHPYQNSGTYIVVLTLTHSGGTTTAQQTITIYPPPEFNFSKLNDSICSGNSIAFSSTVTYPSPTGIVSYTWNFGDGMTSSSPNPSHVYAKDTIDRKYNVSLTVMDNHGCQKIVTKSEYVTVFAVPKVNFSANDTAFCQATTPTAQNIVFTNKTSAIGDNTYQWNFGDGTATNTQTHPSHIYNPSLNSSYSVTLTATNHHGCSDNLTKTDYIQFSSFVSSFDVSRVYGCQTLNLSVRGKNGGGTQYNWKFGNGGSISSYSETVFVTYHGPGDYFLTLHTVTPQGCEDFDTVPIRVFAKTPPAMLLSDTIWCNPHKQVTFTNTSVYPYSEDFGLSYTEWLYKANVDNKVVISSLSTGSPFSHVVGHYTPTIQATEIGGVEADSVCMVSTTPYGCVLDTICEPIWINRISFLSKGGLEYSGHCVPATVTMDYDDSLVSTSPIVSAVVYWNYPDTNNKSVFTDSIGNADPFYSIKLFLQHTYYDTGIYTIYYQIVNAQGCVLELMSDLKVGRKPLVDFLFTPLQECYSVFELHVEAYDSLDSQGNLVAQVPADDWKWGFIETLDRVEVGKKTILKPDVIGHFNIWLLASHNFCPADTLFKDSKSYVCPPIAKILAPATIDFFCDSGTVNFKEASVLPTMHFWWYGDSTRYTGSNSGWLIKGVDSNPSFDYLVHGQQYLYDRAGEFTATLIAVNNDTNPQSPTYNPCGYCADTVDIAINISIAQLDLRPATESRYCQNEEIVFSDSSISCDTIVSWYVYTLNEKLNMFEKKDSSQFHFKFPDSLGVFSQKIGNVSRFGCIREINYRIYLYPASIPIILSSTDSLLYDREMKMLCANNPDTIYLQDSSYTKTPYDTMEIVKHHWQIYSNSGQFADSVFGKNASFVDTSAGIHSVKLTITNSAGCVSSTTINDHLFVTRVIPYFVCNADSQCFGNEVIFYSRSMLFPEVMRDYAHMTFTWDFGDGSPTESYGAPNAWVNPPPVNHIYDTTAGKTKFPVTLTVTYNELNCTESYTDTINLRRVKANFTDDGHTFPCPSKVGRMITFQDSSEGNIVWWGWTFGDTISGSANEVYGNDKDTAIHTYTRSGYFDVSLTVVDNIGCTDSITIPQRVFIDGPQGSFSYAPLSGCLDLDVNFIPNILLADTIIINPDGANTLTQSGININDTMMFTYVTANPYVPYFYLIKWVDNSGIMERCVVEWSGNDTVYPIQLTADFITESPYCSENEIEFTYQSSVIPPMPMDSILWDFGNGMSGINPVVQYDTGGNYTVRLFVYAKDCNIMIEKEIEIILLPSMNFIPDTAAFCKDGEVTFEHDSLSDTTNVTEYQWLFSDGVTSTDYPFVRSFSQVQTLPYEVKVTFDMSETCFKTYRDTINILINGSPDAEFEANPWEDFPESPVNFQDLSTPSSGTITSWWWNFGDNDTSDIQNPSHTYHYSGYFDVLLKVTDEYDCWDTISHQVKMKEMLRFPNIFTPDMQRDGKYYRFRPMEVRGTFKEFRITVYDRWGVAMWEQHCQEPDCPSKEDEFWWDGRNKLGVRVVDGVYFWVVSTLSFTDSAPLQLNGSVTVIGGNHSR